MKVKGSCTNKKQRAIVFEQCRKKQIQLISFNTMRVFNISEKEPTLYYMLTKLKSLKQVKNLSV
jgi:hypothetical protein